MEGEHRMQQSS